MIWEYAFLSERLTWWRPNTQRPDDDPRWMRIYELYIAGTLQARWSWFSTAADPFEDATVKVGSAPRPWWPLTQERNLDPWDVKTHDLFGLIGSQGWELVSADASRAVAFAGMYVGDYTGTGSRPVSRLWTFKRAKD